MRFRGYVHAVQRTSSAGGISHLRHTCTTPWHASCLSSPPATLASTLQWECPGEIDPHGGVVAESGKIAVEEDDDVLAALGENLTCIFCMQLPERPVTAPCGHNFCLKCFEKWAVGQGKRTCPECAGKFLH
ncbi:unnamed protein product [Microthlaspi erraticum]|uniref:RING-type E3 ubiquitin transferase n=1 Tax=Microthlaspi erraticum TaxID=1685480 RepID=A0A6D2IR52_9BRAS|nr:unnamed protein product [Microthlaspi erraticum]